MLKTLFCYVTLLFATDVVVCKPDYLFDHEVGGWLKLHPVPATWFEAFLSCHYEGNHGVSCSVFAYELAALENRQLASSAVLASPNNDPLATAMRGIMRQLNLDNSIFLGVTASSHGVFRSIEGVPLADLSITWATYGDVKTPTNCLSLSTDGKTYISSCTLALPYICYKRKDSTIILNQCGTFDDDYSLYRAMGSCYKFHKTPRTWNRADQICAAEGGHLVIINDKREADIVTDFLDKPTSEGNWGEAAHIGLRDWNNDQTWLTIHGEKIENVYNAWAKGQPDAINPYCCSVIWTRGYLDDVHCAAKKRFICEKNPNTSRFENK